MTIWLIVIYSAEDIATVVQSLDMRSHTRVIRWGILAAIMIFWSELIDHFGKRLTEEQVERAKMMRGRIVWGVIGFEVFVVESVFQYIV